jgi:hypothetical protein
MKKVGEDVFKKKLSLSAGITSLSLTVGQTLSVLDDMSPALLIFLGIRCIT